MNVKHIPHTKLVQLAEKCKDANGIFKTPNELTIAKLASAIIEQYKQMENVEHLMIETIVELAKANANYVEQDWSKAASGAEMQRMMLANSSAELFYVRFAHLIGEEIKSQEK